MNKICQIGKHLNEVYAVLHFDERKYESSIVSICVAQFAEDH